MIIKLLNNTYAQLSSKKIQSILIRNFASNTESNLIKQTKDIKLNNNEVNKFILPTKLIKTLPAGNKHLLQMRLQQLDQTNKLLLHLNKQIEGYPHRKINDSLNNYSVSNESPSVKFIDYTFNKNIKGNLGNISVQSTSRVGIINFVTKIIKSLFNSLSSLVGNIQFINQHDKLILRIKYYQNTQRNDSLYSNKDVNLIYKNLLNLTKANKKLINNNLNILNSEPFKATSFNYNYLNSTGLSIPKRVLINYLKDLINLNINKTAVQPNNSALPHITVGAVGGNSGISMQNHNFIDFDDIDNKITNEKLIENKNLPLQEAGNSKIINSNKSFNNNLIRNLIRTNTLDYLNNKRLKSLRLIKNKPLLSKLLKNYYKEQLTKGDLININAGKFTQSVDPKILNKLSRGVIGIKGTIGSTDYAPEYYNISNYLIATDFINSKSDLLKKEGKGNNLNYLSDNNNKSFILKLKLANKITKSITALKLKYNNDYNQILNNIYNKIILNNKSSMFSTLQNKTSINSLLESIKVQSKEINTVTPGINKIFNILKLISILNSKFNGVNTINSNIILTKIKQGFLSNIYYNNKTNNNSNILKNSLNKFKALGIFLSKIFAKNVEIQLIRLWSIGLDSAIMTQIISKNSNFNNSRVIIRKLWKKIVINNAAKLILRKEKTVLNQNSLAYNIKNLLNNKVIVSKGGYRSMVLNMLNVEKNNLKLDQINDFTKNYSLISTNPITLAKPIGVFVNVNGRLATERIQPRKTTKRFSVGSKGDVKDTYRFTSKNKRGSFSVVIKMGQARN